MARHLAPFSCRQTIAEIVRRRSWGGVLPLGRHASISGSRSIHAPSVSIALSSFQEGQNARHHNQFKLEQALAATAAGRDRGRAFCVLNRRTGDIAIGAEDTVVAWLWAEQHAAPDALVEELARIGGHGLRRAASTMRAG